MPKYALIASAVKKAVQAGRKAFLAGRMPGNLYTASAWAPTGGVIASASHGNVA